MQVFGQRRPAVNMKRVVRPHRAHDAAQKIDLPCERVIAAPLQKIDSTCGAMRCAYCALRVFDVAR